MTKAPAIHATLVDWMKRVDKHQAATQRKASRDAAIAESRHNIAFRSAGQAGLGQPC